MCGALRDGAGLIRCYLTVRKLRAENALCGLHVPPPPTFDTTQGYLARMNPPPVGPYSSSMLRDLWWS